MKKLLMTLLAASAICCLAEGQKYWNVRGGIGNSVEFLKQNRAGNQYIFFIGGKVLQGDALKNKNLRYSLTFINALKRNFGGGPMEIRQPMDGGADFARYRTAWGQAIFGEMICSGHLAVIDFAADEHDKDVNVSKGHLEALLRQIVLYRATHSRVLLITLTPEMFRAYRAGKEPAWVAMAEELAAHYNIPSVNLARAAYDAIAKGELTYKEFSADGLEPTDAGAKIYNRTLDAFIDDLVKVQNPDGKIVRHTLPKPLTETLDSARAVAYEHASITRKGSWQDGQESPVTPFRHILIANKIGDELTFKFTGTEVGIFDVAARDGADITWSIDGGAWQKLAKSTDEKPAMRHVLFARNLAKDTPHTLNIKLASKGAFRLGGMMVNGMADTSAIFKPKSTLDYIDHIYSQMKPVEYTPPADRHKFIPQTMKRLREGDDLKMVLLGDSIIGCTSASNFDLLLGRKYPKCKIKKITSIRSSTGCSWYCKENRVQEWVLKHEPDVVVIGGLSHHDGDGENVRSVVQQIRAARPGQEIVIVTPVLGPFRRGNSWLERWTEQIDHSRKNIRAEMEQVAHEEKCAFFDIASPAGKYFLTAGKTPGWFMRDTVHSNDRGHQIIGRLYEIWF